MRLAPPEEKTTSSIPKSGKDNKRKRALKPEDPQDKKAHTRRLRRRFSHVDVDLAHDSPNDEDNDGEESALMPQTMKPIKTAKPSEPETSSRGKGTSKKYSGDAPMPPEIEIVHLPSTSIPEYTSVKTLKANQNSPSEELRAMTVGHSLSLPSYFEEESEDANALCTLDLSKVLEEDPFQDYFAGVDDAAELNDASTLFKEAQHLISRVNTCFHYCIFLFLSFSLTDIPLLHV